MRGQGLPSGCRRATATKRATMALLGVVAIVLMSSACNLLNSSADQASHSNLVISASLPSAKKGAPYQGIVSASGGTAPYTYSVSTGQMPAGLSLTDTGMISGKPSEAGNFSFDVMVVDGAGVSKSSAKFSLSVQDAIPDPGNPVAVSVSPSLVTLASGGTQQFAAAVTNTSDLSVNWSASKGTISNSGLYSAPAVTADTAVTITATSVVDPTKQASASVTVKAAVVVSVSINPLSVTIASSASQKFSATVNNANNSSVNWTASVGTISTSGLYTALAVSTLTTATITATSAADSTKFATASVTITPPPPIAVTVSPSTLTLASSGSHQFTATVSNSSNTAVTWTASTGAVNTSGFYTAPSVSTTTTATITATSVADATKSASSTVTITPPPPISVSVTPSSVTLASGASRQFTATVSNSSNTTATWTASSGTISAGGFYTAPVVLADTTATVTATSVADSSKSASSTVSLTPPPPVVIVTASLPAGVDGVGYNTSLSAQGGKTPYIWSITAGTLPAGLQLSSAGVISGTSSQTGQFGFTVRVADSNSPALTSSASLTLTVLLRR